MAIADSIRRQPDPPSARGGLSPGQAPFLPHLPLHCPRAVPIGAAPAPAAPGCPPPLSHYSPAAPQRAPLYSPHPQPAQPAHARPHYEGHEVVHCATQRAAEASRLIAPARLPTAKGDLYLSMAAFSSALGILSALRAAQTGDQVANVLIAKAACWGAEGPAVSAALADWVLYLEAGDFLTLADKTRQRCAERLWQSMAALPDTTPFAAVATASAWSADVPPDIRTALLQTADRGTFWAALVGAVATAACPGACRRSRRLSRTRGACRRCLHGPEWPPSTCRVQRPPPRRSPAQIWPWGSEGGYRALPPRQ